MVKTETITKNITTCDQCGNEIKLRDFYKNDGSFQADSVRLMSYDICRGCALEVLTYIKIEDKAIIQYFEKLNDKKNKNMLNNVDIQKLNFDFK